MKIIIIVFAISAPLLGRDTGAYYIAKDFKQTEDIINTIINEPSDAKKSDAAGAATSEETAKEGKNAAAPAGDKAAAPERAEVKDKKAAAAKEESAPRVTNEEQLLLKTGIDFYNSGMHDHALKKFQDLGAKFPQGTYKSSAHYWAGKTYLKMYRYDDAIKEFSAITIESGDYPASLYYAGESYQMKGDQISSIEYYQKVQSQFPSHELADRALLNMGRLYLNQKKGAQALDSAVRIIKYYKDRDTIDDAYYLIGKVYEKDPRLKDVETARKIYKQFIKKGESDARFGKSPLLVRVREDLQRLEKTYFKMEK